MNEAYLTAVHESGHAVLSTVFDIPLEYTEMTYETIKGNLCVSGYTSNVPFAIITKDMDKIEKGRLAVLWLISSAGGIAAEMMVGASNRDDQWVMDYRQLEALMPEGADLNDPIGVALHFLKDYPGIKKAHAIIRQKLLTKRRVSGQELDDIIKSKITRKERNFIKQDIWDHIPVK